MFEFLCPRLFSSSFSNPAFPSQVRKVQMLRYREKVDGRWQKFYKYPSKYHLPQLRHGPNHPTEEENKLRVARSKKLSALLENGSKIPKRKDGFARVRDVLNAPELQGLDFMNLEMIAKRDHKNRFTLSWEPHALAGTSSKPELDSWWIRANAGQPKISGSKLELKLIRSPNEIPIAVHGTSPDAWKRIRIEGLRTRLKPHIHLAKNLQERGVIHGTLDGPRILIYIDVDHAMADGIKFYLSTDGIIVTEGHYGFLKPKYFGQVDSVTKTYMEMSGWEEKGIAALVKDTNVGHIPQNRHWIVDPKFVDMDPQPAPTEKGLPQRKYTREEISFV